MHPVCFFAKEEPKGDTKILRGAQGSPTIVKTDPQNAQRTETLLCVCVPVSVGLLWVMCFGWRPFCVAWAAKMVPHSTQAPAKEHLKIWILCVGIGQLLRLVQTEILGTGCQADAVSPDFRTNASAT